MRNKVLPIKERRGNETNYMVSGCDSKFEGQLLLYALVLAILEKLLGAAGDVSSLIADALKLKLEKVHSTLVHG